MEKESFLYKVRHSLAHILAQAVQKFYPQAKLGFGPPIENGFYYDFDLGKESINNEELKKIEKQMKKIISQNQQFQRSDMDYEKALELLQEYKQGNETYKVENIQNLKQRGIKNFSFYQNGDFLDLCEGPHLDFTSKVPKNCFKLDKIAAAYWLGDENNPSLTRIYALCFENEQELKDYIKKREIAEKNSHHKLGRELDIFEFNDTIGKGLPLWLPNGTIIKDCIEEYAKEMEFKYNYHRVSTPHIAKKELYLKSQHLPAYEDSMFPALIDKEDNTHWYLKPMNCPHHHLIYASRPKSYKQLPYRIAEYGTCYRYEQSGELSGLLRVRCLTMNDGHIYLAKKQLKEEFRSLMKMYLEFYDTFNLKDYHFRLSIRGDKKEKFKGDPKLWDEAEKFLEDIMKELKVNYQIGYGEAAFYGPKIDIQFKNLLGREETVSTIQVDYLSGKNFNLKYIDENNSEQEPIIIHRAPLSTHERFISFLIEYYAGAFPVWCSPTQIMVIPINEKFMPYCQEIQKELKEEKIRVEIDDSSHSFNKKIRINTMRKIPIILIIGENEFNNQMLTIRRYGITKQETIDKTQFKKEIQEEITKRVFQNKKEEAK